jgi:3-methyl-2-oxobutanoate hydroxymethyltransferase
MLGLSFSKTSPRFVRQYADLRAAMGEAIQAYADDVRAGAFPSEQESYPLPADAATELGLARGAADKESKKP